MIKLFRNIRQKLLNEGKSTRYLKYAIGEIILVVIGILIALQINNWNENTKSQAKESTYLKNLQRDLNDQVASIDEQIYYETRFIEDASYLITFFNKNGLKNLDSVFFTKISDLHSRKTFVTTDPTYTDLISSGNIDLIKTNKNLKDHLIRYYQELERVEKIIQNNNTFLTDQQFGPVLLNIGYFYTDIDPNRPVYAEVESAKLTTLYDAELANASEELLASPSNRLKLMNIINSRHVVSLSHLSLLQNCKQNTEKLLIELSKRN